MSHNFFRVNTQFENLGDALINRELIKKLMNTEKGVVCTKNVPLHFIKNLDIKGAVLVNSVLFFYFLMFKSKFSRNKVNYFLNPGGYGGSIKITKAVKYLITTLIFIFLRVAGIRIHRVGVSFSNMSSIHGYLLRFQSNFLCSNSVRDSISLKTCQELKIKVTKIVPDYAFSLQYDLGDFEKTYDIVISIREPNDKELLFNSLDSIVARTQGKILLAYQVKFDKEFQELLYQRYKSHDVELRDLSKLISENEKLFRQCKYVISNRLHVLLLAMSKGALPIALIDPKENSKIQGIFQDADLDTFLNDYTSYSDFNFMITNKAAIQNIFPTNDKLIDEFFSKVNA
jgi:polysaccharide pyruvyl transferase WcaK-like protein